MSFKEEITRKKKSDVKDALNSDDSLNTLNQEEINYINKNNDEFN